MQGDFNQLAEDPNVLTPSFFDFIYSRMVIFGISDWQAYIARAVKLLKPDGWLELQEIDLTAMLDEQQNSVSESWQWPKDQHSGWAARGLDLSCAPKLAGYMQQAGLKDVHVKEYRWAFGPRQGHPEVDFLAAYSNKYLADTNFGAYRRLLGGGLSDDALARVQAEIRDTLSKSEEGKHYRFFVTYGRKA